MIRLLRDLFAATPLAIALQALREIRETRLATVPAGARRPAGAQ